MSIYDVPSPTRDRACGPVDPRIQPFLPDQLENLEFWMRSDSGVTADGWTDRLGAYDLNQKLGAPTLVSNAINGRPAVRFDGIDDAFYSLSSPSGFHDCTFFLAFNPRIFGANAGIFSFFPTSGDDFNSVDGLGFHQVIGPSRLFLIRLYPNNSSDLELASASATADTWCLATFQLQAGIARLWLNGVLTTDAYAQISPSNPGGFVVGARRASGFSNFGANDYGEILFYSSALGSSSIEKVWNYQKNFWGISF